MLIRFIIYGLLGWCGEIVWTATREKLSGQQRDWKLRSTTYLWVSPLYSLILPLKVSFERFPGQAACPRGHH